MATSRTSAVYRYNTKATSKTVFTSMVYEAPPAVYSGSTPVNPDNVRAGMRVTYGSEFPGYALKRDMTDYAGLYLHSVPTTSTFTGGSAALSGQIRGGNSGHGLIGVLGTAHPGANGVPVFAGNFLATSTDRDAPVTASGATNYANLPWVVGVEGDTNNHSATTNVCASFMAATGGSVKGVTDAAFYVVSIPGPPVVRRGHGLWISDNSVEVGAMFGSAQSGNSQHSVAAQWRARDGSGVEKYGSISQQHGGAFLFSYPSGGAVQVHDQGTSGVISIQPTRLTLSGGIIWAVGAGTPEAAVTAPVGSLFLRTDGGASTTLYVKTSGTGNTGWTAK
jgi:hypothetical protein